MLLLPVILFNVVTSLYALPTNKSDDLFSRVWYGEKATIKDYPFFAALGPLLNKDHQYYCGAVILSKWWLATAAHCVIDSDTLGQRVWVGEDSSAPTSRPYTFNKVIIYPDYITIPDVSANDIALLKLTRPLTFNNNVKAIKLPERNYELNAVYTVAGMGIDETQQSSNHLMSTNLHTVKANECWSDEPILDSYLDKIGLNKTVLNRVTICTKRNEDKPGLCSGDSGSPLIQGNTLIGIASFINVDIQAAISCKKATRFAFTNVAPFVGWIKKNTGIR